MDSKGQKQSGSPTKTQEVRGQLSDFVLEKGIFSNIFEKDIRRVYIYKKAERLAKAIHLVSPAFRNSPALRDRMDQIAVGLVDAAVLPPQAARDSLSRELLALSSVLSIGRTGGLLSGMNAELISREAHQLLQEVAAYEEPRLFLDDTPTLAELAREVAADRSVRMSVRTSQFMAPASGGEGTPTKESGVTPREVNKSDKGQIIKDKNSDRRSAIRSILESKGPSYIKDISMVIRDVSEKTIQRELQSMVDSGEISKSGERRWTTYALK